MGSSASKTNPEEDQLILSTRLEQEAEKTIEAKTRKLFQFMYREVEKSALRGYKKQVFLFTHNDEKEELEFRNVTVVTKDDLVEIAWMAHARQRVMERLMESGIEVKEEYVHKRKERVSGLPGKVNQYVWYGPSRKIVCTWDRAAHRDELRAGSEKRIASRVQQA